MRTYFEVLDDLEAATADELAMALAKAEELNAHAQRQGGIVAPARAQRCPDCGAHVDRLPGAPRLCTALAKRNEAMGVTPREALDIVASSMRAQNLAEQARAASPYATR